MARTLDIDGLPSGMTLTCEVYAMGGNAVVETITLTERTVAKTNYTGTIVTASGANYKLGIKSGSSFVASSTVYIGATDGLTYYTRPQTNLTEVMGTDQTARDLGGNLDAAVSSRMATYTQPTGFLAATFPTTVASTTNITAGTITTVTNLTNAATAGDLTATMKTSVTAAVPSVAAIQSGLATSSAVSALQADTDDIQTRLPAALVSGRMDASVGAMATDTLTADALDSSAVTEIQSGLGTSADVIAIKAKTDNLPTDPADQSAVEAAIAATVSGLATEANAASNRDTILTNVASRSSQTSVDDLPTNAELAAAIAAINNLSAVEVADAVLLRDWTAIIATIPDRCALQAMRALRNRFDTTTNLGFVTVFGEDDVTPEYTKTLVTNANASPIVRG